ncbi:MAG TPA: DUF1844 domain-containing protein [Pyrinomonadaceae bacterium]|jgi:hypothetical protein
MSEEKPTFKITDRRLFNTDGTPRDIEREEEPATTNTVTSDATADSRVPDSPVATAAAPDVSVAATTPPASPSATAQDASPAATAAVEREEPQTGGDPTAFVNLVMFIASPAAAAMGMTEHPGMSAHDIDLPLAKHCIDLLATLRQKTNGNLSAQEEQIFDGLLAELRMQFVALSTPRPGTPGAGGGGRGPRGFTGSDITGGR